MKVFFSASYLRSLFSRHIESRLQLNRVSDGREGQGYADDSTLDDISTSPVFERNIEASSDHSTQYDIRDGESFDSCTYYTASTASCVQFQDESMCTAIWEEIKGLCCQSGYTYDLSSEGDLSSYKSECNSRGDLSSYISECHRKGEKEKDLMTTPKNSSKKAVTFSASVPTHSNI